MSSEINAPSQKTQQAVTTLVTDGKVGFDKKDTGRYINHHVLLDFPKELKADVVNHLVTLINSEEVSNGGLVIKWGPKYAENDSIDKPSRYLLDLYFTMPMGEAKSLVRMEAVSRIQKNHLDDLVDEFMTLPKIPEYKQPTETSKARQKEKMGNVLITNGDEGYDEIAGRYVNRRVLLDFPIEARSDALVVVTNLMQNSWAENAGLVIKLGPKYEKGDEIHHPSRYLIDLSSTMPLSEFQKGLQEATLHIQDPFLNDIVRNLREIPQRWEDKRIPERRD